MSKHQLFYHFTWSTKYRKPLMDDSNRKIIYRSIVSKSIELGSIVLAINAMEDHIHILVSTPPTITPSILIGQIKGTSSHLIRRLGWNKFSWQGEYGVKTVSESDVPMVMAYIHNQDKHHNKEGK